MKPTKLPPPTLSGLHDAFINVWATLVISTVLISLVIGAYNEHELFAIALWTSLAGIGVLLLGAAIGGILWLKANYKIVRRNQPKLVDIDL